MQIIKDVRHPHLLATFGAWQVGRHLIIAMELAERTLLDRFREAAGQGFPGIPAPEIHEHFLDAARGLDYLNEPRHPSEGAEPMGIHHIGSRLLVIWDGSPIHRRAEVKDFLASAEGRGVHVERLPPYAPDLNPVEGAWEHLKHVELRNMVFLDLEELHLELHLAIGRLRQRPRLIRSFFEGAGLPIENFPSFCNAQ